MSYRDRMSSPGPKKLPALDGGGIRGVITLEILQRLESILENSLGAGDEFVLGDYCDYTGGTSTGGDRGDTAKGLRVGELLDLYVRRCEDMSTTPRCGVAITTGMTACGFGKCCRASSAGTRRWAARS